MACLQSRIFLYIIFMCACAVFNIESNYTGNDANGAFTAAFFETGKHQGYYKRSYTDFSNEIESDVGDPRAPVRNSPPNGLKDEGQCDFLQIQKMHRECTCHKPRKQCVRINNPHGHVVNTIPECVIIERCEGICPYSKSCVPQSVEQISVPIIVLSLKPDTGGSNSMEVIRECKTIQVEKHVKCECDCGITKDECSSKQVFSSTLCKCMCLNPKKPQDCKEQNKFWDESTCECICPPQVSKTCSTGAFFHETRCKCIPIEAERAYRGTRLRPFRRTDANRGKQT